jgi:hypothetical protein
VSLEHRRRGVLDRVAVGDVAELVLAAGLRRELAQPFLAPSDQDAAPAARGQPPRKLGSDSGGGPGDDSYALNAVTVPRLIATVSSIGSA